MMRHKGMSAPLSRLGKQVAEAAAALNAIDARFALIGGLALASYKVVRATQDVGLLADAEQADAIDTELAKLGRLQAPAGEFVALPVSRTGESGCGQRAFSTRSHTLSLLAGAFLFAWFATCVQAQGDGPRAYLPSPVDTNVATVYGEFMQGNQSQVPGTVTPGSHVDIDLGYVEYSRSFAVDGFLSSAYISLPFGRESGTLTLGQSHYSQVSSGIGDLEIGAALSLVGAPPMSERDFAAYTPGLVVNGLFKVYVPTGAYSSSHIFNLGTHRWAFELGAPMAYYIGASFTDPQLTTFEVLPSATFYSDNNDPFHAETQAQAPLYGVEFHVTRNLIQRFWMSVDGGWEFGGETTTDGVKDGNSQRSFFLGGTLSLDLSPSASVNVTYGGTVNHNAAGMDVRMFRATFTLSF